jgi:hypothetical protein
MQQETVTTNKLYLQQGYKKTPHNIYELIQHVYSEYAALDGSDTYANCLIKVIKFHRLWPAIQVKKFKSAVDGSLVLLHNTYQREDVKRFKELYDQCRSVVLDFNANQVVVSYSNNIPERISVEEYSKLANPNIDKYQEAYDGTMITVYNFNNTWHFGTSSCTDAYISKFNNTSKTHGHMFNEALMFIFRSEFSDDEVNSSDPQVIANISQRLRDMFTSHLDPSLAYEFVLVHCENPHIIDYTQVFGAGYKVIFHINSKNRQTLQEVDLSATKPLAHLGMQYPVYHATLNDAYAAISSPTSYGFIAKTLNGSGGTTKLYKISPTYIEFKEETDPCNPNVWHNILMVYMKNRKDYKINDYIKMYAPNLQLPYDNNGKPVDPTYLIHTMILTLKDVLYNLYSATTVYDSKTRRFKMNKELDQQFPPVIRFHLAQLRYRQQHEHSNSILKPKDVYYYLCHCNNVKNIKLLITLLATTVGYNISERSAMCLNILYGLL